jgi:hypothetical protein
MFSRLFLAAFLAALTLPVFAGVGPKSVQIVPSTTDGDLYSEFPDGDNPVSTDLEFSGTLGGLNAAGITAITCPDGFSHDVRQYLSGTESATAEITITSVSGDNPITAGWLDPSTGNDLVYDCTDSNAAGVFTLLATGISSSDTSSEIAWTATTPGPPPESGYGVPGWLDGSTVSASPLNCEATFHNIGCTWDETANNTSNEVQVRYKDDSTNVWKQALNFWWDARTNLQIVNNVPVAQTVPNQWSLQARGSIVGLEEGTTYTVQVLTESTGITATDTVTTRDSTALPIDSTVTPDLTSNAKLTISVGGNATDGYVRYFRTGGWLIDGNNAITDCVVVNASYVIIDGLTCKETTKNGVLINADHVVVRNSDISEYGRQDGTTGFACQPSAGITLPQGQNFGITHTLIENNSIHDPNYDSNSWDENGDGDSTSLDFRVRNDSCQIKATAHPQGSSGIEFHNAGGNNVIRYNLFYSTTTKMFKDVMSGASNFSFDGDVGPNSDIYRNSVTHSWDDLLQSEGANANVRIYENYTAIGRTCHAKAPVSIGPLYLFRNVCEKGLFGSASVFGEGWFFKVRSKPDDADGDDPPEQVYYGTGALFAINNTVISSIKNIVQLDEGATGNIKAWNNIFSNSNALSGTYRTWIDAWADFEDNLYGNGHARPTDDAGGVSGTVTFTGTGTAGTSAPFTPSSSNAIDSGTVIPNFTDGYSGDAPDKGAVEVGQTDVVYGPQ